MYLFTFPLSVALRDLDTRSGSGQRFSWKRELFVLHYYLSATLDASETTGVDMSNGLAGTKKVLGYVAGRGNVGTRDRERERDRQREERNRKIPIEMCKEVS